MYETKNETNHLPTHRGARGMFNDPTLRFSGSFVGPGEAIIVGLN
jgi:hypothetical protein